MSIVSRKILRRRVGLICSVVILAAALSFSPVENASAENLPVGESEFRIKAPRGEVPIYTYRSSHFGPHSPIWIILHGVGRTADDYFDVWRPFAEEHGALLLVPEFTKQQWPDSWRYALGNASTSKLVNLTSRDWAFTVVQKAFATAVQMTRSHETGFHIYGHSAGAQFVHRYVMHTGGAGVKLAISANAGWYILPDHEHRFPYGLRNSSISESNLRRAFATPMVILLGQEDTIRGANVRAVAETDAQGPHRLARGRFFFKRSAGAAHRMQAPFHWRIVEVPGAGHRNDEMAPAAARIFAESR
jgi:predicted esterase